MTDHHIIQPSPYFPDEGSLVKDSGRLHLEDDLAALLERVENKEFHKEANGQQDFDAMGFNGQMARIMGNAVDGKYNNPEV